MLTFVASVFVFGMLVFFHELGHFAVAKLVGIKVHEFSLGFGPRLFGIPVGETSYNVRALPLGGFVRMAGMDPNEEEDPKDEQRGFNKKTVGQRIAVIFAGPLMNFLLAVLLASGVFFFQGLPVPSAGTKIGQVVPNSPAEKAGILPGDRIVAVNDRPVEKWVELVSFINQRPEQDLKLTVVRDGAEKQLEVKTLRDENGLGKIGIYQGSDFV
ncbi:MAG: site-2 protease family protein, partial [Peptococcaceae bacterium]|nr:site-2 protease family protein [Peptococcaceae bacterium]